MHGATVENKVNIHYFILTLTSTESCKWMLCLVKSRGLHKSTKEDFTIMRTLRPYSSWTTRAYCADSRGKNLLS